MTGWIAGSATLASLYLPGRVRLPQQAPTSAEAVSLAAAAEASVDAGEPILGSRNMVGKAPPDEAHPRSGQA